MQARRASKENDWCFISLDAFFACRIGTRQVCEWSTFSYGAIWGGAINELLPSRDMSLFVYWFSAERDTTVEWRSSFWREVKLYSGLSWGNACGKRKFLFRNISYSYRWMHCDGLALPTYSNLATKAALVQGQESQHDLKDILHELFR